MCIKQLTMSAGFIMLVSWHWCSLFLFQFRLDEAALSLQKEKSIYKEIENYPTCYKVKI